jgi:hypothetical protein
MTPKVTTMYIVLVEKVLVSLAMQVNDHTAKGWKPQGGIAVVKDGCETRYYQAMIKESN